MDFNALKCQHEDCGLILENPVTLVCDYNVCRHHLDGLEKKFKCFFLSQTAFDTGGGI